MADYTGHISAWLGKEVIEDPQQLALWTRYLSMARRTEGCTAHARIEKTEAGEPVMHVSAIEGHQLWAPRYEHGPNPMIALDSRVLTSLLQPLTANRFLDIACGTGRWMRHLHERGGVVIGIDLCREMLEVAGQCPGLKDRCVLADATSLPIASEAIDVTLCSLALGYLSDLNRVLFEMARVTRRGGRIIISDLHPAASSAGWKRSFRSDSGVYEIDHATYSKAEVCQAGTKAALCLKQQRTECFSESERRLFEIAGKSELFDQISKIPALWVTVWTKQ
jgi:ubiquinone/menaquinone biosynthesis C-methylase UbiE